MDTIVIQFGLGVLLFLIINWIGKHSYSIGYMSISVFAKVEEAPAFNFVIRVLTPVIYIIVTASVFYALKLDKYVNNFYLVNVYYILFRLLFNLFTGRGLLLDWYRQFLYWISIIVISYFTYIKIIVIRENLLPDFSTISNELWIIILIFLFHVTNNVRFSNKRTVKRKENYVLKMCKTFNNKFGDLIEEQIKNDHLKGLILSILIIENFNRPRLIRWIEYLRFYLTGKPHTLGVMQVYTKKYISDRESVNLGIDKILKGYNNLIKEVKEGKKSKDYSVYSLKDELIGIYNSGNDYCLDVFEMWNQVMNMVYPDTKDKLIK
jgi:hypothetical protein